MDKSPFAAVRPSVGARIVLAFAFVLSLGTSARGTADEIAPIKYPFLEWYGLWPGRTAIGEDGAIWTQDMPEGVHLAVQPARKSRIFIKGERPWETPVPQPQYYLPPGRSHPPSLLLRSLIYGHRT